MALDDVSLGSGGSAVPKLTRSHTSRQCLACQHRDKLPDIREPPGTAPATVGTAVLPTPLPQAVPTPVRRDVPVQTVIIDPPKLRQMAAKPENMTEALEDRDPNNLNQHVQVRIPTFQVLQSLIMT